LIIPGGLFEKNENVKMKEIKEIFEVFHSRIKSPLFGYATLSFILINWKPLIYLLLSKATMIKRISYFEENTSYTSLLILPIVFAIVCSVIYPWVNYFFLILCKKPTDLRNSIQAQSEHTLIVEKQKLENARNAFFADQEKELIERAKRDQELENIDNQDTKKKVQSEIEQLRAKRDQMTEYNPKNKMGDEFEYFITIAKDLRAKAEIAKKTGDILAADEYIKEAMEYDNKAILVSKKRND